MKKLIRAIAWAVLPSILLLPGCTSEKTVTGTRTFYMGFTPFPYAFTAEGIQDTKKLISENADAILFHMDEGIPWNEIHDNGKFNKKAEQEFGSKLENAPANAKIVTAVTPLNGDRTGIAGYWGESGNEPMTGIFKDKTFDDPLIIKTYIDYCKAVIRKVKPVYFIYGIEVNLIGKNRPELWPQFADLCKETYTSLKKDFPDLPLMFSIQLGDFYEQEAKDRENLALIMPYTDFLAVSCYPFNFSGNTAPDKIPADYFSKIRSLAPEKPFAIAETGYMAEDMVIKSANIEYKSNEDYQKKYVDFLLNAAQKEQAKFIFWFIPRDYDELWLTLEKSGAPEWFKLWKDNGLVSGDGKVRKALGVWKEWLDRPRLEL